MGFKDVDEKGNKILKNQKKLKDLGIFPEGAPPVTYIESLVEYELWINCHDTSQILIRGSWFFDFMGEIMYLFVQHEDWTMTKVASVAYEKQLSKHHNWLTKKIV